MQSYLGGEHNALLAQPQTQAPRAEIEMLVEGSIGAWPCSVVSPGLALVPDWLLDEPSSTE